MNKQQRDAENWKLAGDLAKVLMTELQQDIRSGKVTDKRLINVYGDDDDKS